MTTNLTRQQRGTRILNVALRSIAPIGEGGMGVVEDLWVNLAKLRGKGYRTDLLRRCMLDETRCDLVRPSRREEEAACKVVKRGKASHLESFFVELRMTRNVVDALARSGIDADELTALPATPYYYHLVIPEQQADVPLIPMRRMASDAFEYLRRLFATRYFRAGASPPVAIKAAALVRCVATFLVFCDAIHSAGLVHVDAKLDNMLVRDRRCSPIQARHLPSEFVVIDFGLSRVERRGGGLRNAGGTPGYVSPMLRPDEMARALWASAGCARDYDDLLVLAHRGAPPTRSIDFHSLGASIAHVLLSTAQEYELRQLTARVVQILLLGSDGAREKLERLSRLTPDARPFYERAKLAARTRRENDEREYRHPAADGRRVATVTRTRRPTPPETAAAVQTRLPMPMPMPKPLMTFAGQKAKTSSKRTKATRAHIERIRRARGQ